MAILNLVVMLGMTVICGGRAFADDPKFKLDPDFVYLASDQQSLANVKFYPAVQSEYERVYTNLRKGMETADEGLIVMHLAYALGEYEELEKIGKFVLKKDAKRDEARLILAMSALNHNQPELAELFLDQIVDRVAGATAKMVRGLVAFQQKRPDLAIDILESVLRSEPKNYAAAMNLGLIWMDLQMYAPAEDHFSDIVKRHPNGYDAKLQLALARAGLGKKAKALAIIEELKKLFPTSEYLNQAMTAVAKGKP